MFFLLFISIKASDDTWGYELMKREMPEYCDDVLLIDSSIQETENDCLEQCATTGDPG